ncbi:MAG TPA: hypothetical protein VIP56_02915 [Nitrososphaeraceae archaeon]
MKSDLSFQNLGFCLEQSIYQSRFRAAMILFSKILLVVTIIGFSIISLLALYEHNILGFEPRSIYFGQEINISKNNGTSELPQVTAEGNNVYVVWQDNTTGNYDINFKSSSTNGTNFKSTRNLSKNNGTSEFPQIKFFNDVFYVIWNDRTVGTDRIYFREGRIDDSTKAPEFGSLTKLPGNGNVSKPRIFGATHSFSIVWISNFANASLIGYYPLNFFDDSSNTVQLSKLSEKDKIANVSVSGYNTNIYIVWENKKVSNSDIVFKRTDITPLD